MLEGEECYELGLKTFNDNPFMSQFAASGV